MMAKSERPDAENSYYYNLVTGKVEHGLVSGWTERIGPYPTYEAAAHALEIARQRNEEWQRQNDQWDGEV